MEGISIIVLNYENSGRLANCLRAIKKQDFTGKVQIVVIDDGSEDEFAEIISLCRYHEAKLVSLPHSINIGRLINFGFAHSIHETLLIITQDHLLEKDFLSRLSSKEIEGRLIGGKILDSDGNLYYAAQFRPLYAVGTDKEQPSYFDGFGVVISKQNCPLFDTCEEGKIYQHANPRWLERVKHMGIKLEYYDDLVMTHVNHERRE